MLAAALDPDMACAILDVVLESEPEPKGLSEAVGSVLVAELVVAVLESCEIKACKLALNWLVSALPPLE